MLGIALFLMALGGGAYWLTNMRKSAAMHGTLAEQVAALAEQIKLLREAQWQIRTAVDSLSEEQDFRAQLQSPPESKS